MAAAARITVPPPRSRMRFLVPCADPPGDLHVRLISRDREATVLELRSYPCAGRRLEVAQLVVERRLERPGLDGQLDGGVAARVGPHLAVVGDGFRWR